MILPAKARYRLQSETDALQSSASALLAYASREMKKWPTLPMTWPLPCWKKIPSHTFTQRSSSPEGLNCYSASHRLWCEMEEALELDGPLVAVAIVDDAQRHDEPTSATSPR